MRIVHVVDIFHPEGGYFKHIIGKYLIELGHEFIILSSDIVKPDGFTKNWDFNILDHDYTNVEGVPIIRIHCEKYVSGRAIWPFKKYIEKLKEIDPDIIYINGNDSYIGILSTLFWRLLPGVLVLDSHMLEMASSNRYRHIFRALYKTIITPVIKRRNIFVIRAQDDPYVMDAFNIPLKLAPYISLGTDVELFHPDQNVRKVFRMELGIDKEDFVVTYTGKMDEGKGGQLLADAFKSKFETDKNVVLVVVGNTVGEYGRKVEETFSKSINRVIRFPTQKYHDLPKYYQIADLVVFSRQCSLSFFDAQACGIPVLSEDNHINIERCSHNNGWNFESGNCVDYRKKIDKVANMSKRERDKYGKSAREYILNNFSYHLLAKKIEDLFYIALKNTK